MFFILFKVLSEFFVRMQENCLALKPGKQIITIRLLPTILNKGNQAVKFGQLIEYNINIFLK